MVPCYFIYFGKTCIRIYNVPSFRIFMLFTKIAVLVYTHTRLSPAKHLIHPVGKFMRSVKVLRGFWQHFLNRYKQPHCLVWTVVLSPQKEMPPYFLKIIPSSCCWQYWWYLPYKTVTFHNALIAGERTAEAWSEIVGLFLFTICMLLYIPYVCLCTLYIMSWDCSIIFIYSVV